MSDWSLVVPMHQEAARIGATVRTLAASPLAAAELVLVDDGSSDGTADVARRELDSAGLRATVLVLSRNQGKGAAVRAGVLAASRPIIAFVDADLSSPPPAVLEVVQAVRDGADVAVASRAHPDSDLTVRQPGAREGAGKSFNLLLRLLGLTTMPDTQCGLKAFEAGVARQLFEPLVTRRFAFDVEVLARAARLGLDVRVLPTTWAHVEQSRVSPLRDGSRMALDALRIRLALRRLPRRPGVGSVPAESRTARPTQSPDEPRNAVSPAEPGAGSTASRGTPEEGP